MPLRLTSLVRPVDINYDQTRGMSAANPGGGVSVKFIEMKRAVPNIEFVTDVASAGAVNITETLWFSAGKDDFDERVDAYALHNGFKILWTSDLSFTKWTGARRQAIFDATDVIAGNSPYMRDILSVYAEDKVAYLTDPFDVNQISPMAPRERVIYSNSQVIIEKGVGDIVEIFGALGDANLHRVFIGATDNWGMELNPEASRVLDTRLTQVCDRRIRHASRSDVTELAGSAWLVLSFAGYETFGYAQIEALAGGCWVFCGKHLAYRNRPVVVCESPADAVSKIVAFVSEHETAAVNTEGREFVAEKYGPDVFRKQLMGIIGGEIGV